MPFKKYYTDLKNIYTVKKSIIALECDITKIHQNLKRIVQEIYYLYEAMSPEEFEEFKESVESNSDYTPFKKKIHKVKFVKKKFRTPKENAKHRIFPNPVHGRSRIIVQKTLDGNVVQIWVSISLASVTLKISKCCISECCSGKQKTSGGW
ncbi:511_t:CDS:2, partial [Gigaspora rosea]